MIKDIVLPLTFFFIYNDNNILKIKNNQLFFEKNNKIII